jgi:hypothetical protein
MTHAHVYVQVQYIRGRFSIVLSKEIYAGSGNSRKKSLMIFSYDHMSASSCVDFYGGSIHNCASPY